jgi:hypothetical protein
MAIWFALHRVRPPFAVSISCFTWAQIRELVDEVLEDRGE